FAVFLLLFYTVYSYAKKYFTVILVFICAAVVLLCLYGLYQYFYGFDETIKYIATLKTGQIEAVRERLESHRVFSTLIYPNTFAGLLLLVLPVTIGFFKTGRKYRLITGAAIILLITNLLLTKSVGALISLILAVFIVLFFISDQSMQGFRRIFMGLMLIASILLIVVLKMRGFDMFFQGVQAKLEAALRMIDIIKIYPLFGTGAGNFEEVYNSVSYGKSEYLKYGHNLPLQAAVETGLAGLAILAVIGYQGYSAVIKNFYFIRTPASKTMVFSLLVGITAFLIHNLIDFDIYNFEITVVFTVLCAALLSRVKLGLIQLNKVKFSYLLGVNPGFRRQLIFAAVLCVAALCAVTGGRQVYVNTFINLIIAAGFAIWSVSKEDIRRTDLDIPLLLMLAWMAASLFFTPGLYRGIRYFTMISCSVVLYYLTSQFLRKTQYRIAIANFFIFTGSALAALGLGQAVYLSFSGATGSPDAFFPNHNLYAGYLSVAFSFLLAQLLFEKKIDHIWIKSALLVMLITAAGFSFSKSGMLAMITAFTGMIVYFFFSRSRVNDTPRQWRTKNILIASFAGLLALAAFTPLFPSGKKVVSVGSDPYYFNRLEIFRSAAQMALEKPLTGWGVGSFEKVFPSHNFPVKATARFQKETPFAHNELLQVSATLGLPGLALFSLILFMILRNYSTYDGHKKSWAAGAGAYFAILALCVHSLVYFTFHLPGILYTTAILAALIMPQRSTFRTVSHEALIFTRVYYLPALILAFIIFSALIRPAAASRLFSSYRATGKTATLSSAMLADPLNASYIFETGRIFEDSGNLRAAAVYFDRALAFDPKNYIYRLHLARAYAGLDDITAAVDNYNLAIEANPYRAFTYSELANFYQLKTGDADKTRSLLEKAVELEPNYMEAMNNLALLLKKEKKYDESLKQYDKMEAVLKEVRPQNSYEWSLLYMPPGILYINKALTLNLAGRTQQACDAAAQALLNGAVSLPAELTKICGKVKK
ncbi:MAG: O-antigen ligase family protein, partial [Spirochaetia bacterium]|nr:O-antigen ligase family protein [Spirochaetia bacterium]